MVKTIFFFEHFALNPLSFQYSELYTSVLAYCIANSLQKFKAIKSECKRSCTVTPNV